MAYKCRRVVANEIAVKAVVAETQASAINAVCDETGNKYDKCAKMAKFSHQSKESMRETMAAEAY
jgi:fumarate hydratase class II